MFSHDNTSVYNSNLSCLDFSPEVENVVIRLKATLGGITIVVSLLAILLIVMTKKYKDFTFRLVLYLMIIDILQAVAMCLALSPIHISEKKHAAQVRNSEGWEDFCEVTGFLLMTTMWMGNIVIIWILVHLLSLGWRLYRLQVTSVDENEIAQVLNDNVSKGKWEIAGVVFMLIAPFLIGLTPFFISDDMYGISGLWCWIKVLHSSCGDRDPTPLTVVLVFFYAPLILIVFFSVIAMCATIILVCYGAVRRHGKTIVDQHQRRMKEIMLVLAYPMLYCTVCLLLLANRIYSIARPSSTPFIPLWMTHTVADPVRVMLPAVAFLLHPYVWRDLCNRRKPTVHVVLPPREPDQDSHLNGDESVEDKLLAAQDSGKAATYGACEDDKYMASVIEIRK